MYLYLGHAALYIENRHFVVREIVSNVQYVLSLINDKTEVIVDIDEFEDRETVEIFLYRLLYEIGYNKLHNSYIFNYNQFKDKYVENKT